MKKISKKQTSVSGRTLSLVALVVAVVAIIAIVILFITSVQQPKEALAGAARYQAQVVTPAAGGSQKSIMDIMKMVKQVPAGDQNLRGQYNVPRVIECPPVLYPSKTAWEGIPNEMQILAVSLDDNAVKGSFITEKIFDGRACAGYLMLCGYVAVGGETEGGRGGMIIEMHDVKDCVDAGPTSCKCLTK